MTALIITILALINEAMPAVAAGTAAVSTVAKIVTALETIVPLLIQFAKDEVPVVKQFIATLRGSAHITPEQIDSLDVIEAKIDADSDAAYAAATTS